MKTPTDAASFIRLRLMELGARINQDEMQTLVAELKEVMGRTLTAADVNAVVAAFTEIALPLEAMMPFGKPAVTATA